MQLLWKLGKANQYFLVRPVLQIQYNLTAGGRNLVASLASVRLAYPDQRFLSFDYLWSFSNLKHKMRDKLMISKKTLVYFATSKTLPNHTLSQTIIDAALEEKSKGITCCICFKIIFRMLNENKFQVAVLYFTSSPPNYNTNFSRYRHYQLKKTVL